MEYLEASDTDPLFCALLLRLADLLDFDDTRAPKILYGYVMNNEKSRTEWDKHQISAGFNYPLSPSKDALPYKARCKNPGIEHAIRDFLDWVDDELDVCAKLQKRCHKKWQRNFPFPRMVSRKEIESYGYMSGDFCLTMDQLRIMELLAGQSLYEREDTFIRELLQNAMDATLLREEMDQDFSLEDARIDLWEWSDKDGNVWFRVDDMGIGMTLGMLQRYFLKVGNSYYSSKELKCDLRDHGKHNYRSISHFGIGFLSCFQCGTFAEISTLYFDSNKNRKETGNIQPDPITNYGLRLQVTGLTGYYTLKSQAEQHVADISLNSPDFFASKSPKGLENWGYRATPGTSIVIRLDPGRLGAINLHEAAEDYLCCARVPVYYNGVRVGRTYDELMTGVYEIAGERVYTLDQEAQKNFNKCFPSVCGQYPKVAIKVIPIDTEGKSGIAGLSGVIMHYNICFDKIPQWRVKDQIYEVHGFFSAEDKEIVIKSTNKYNNARAWIWYKEHFNQDALNSLTQRFSQFSTCPISPAQLGDAWHPFVESNIDIREVWKSWLDYQYEKSFSILLQDTCYPSIYDLSKSNQLRMIKYSYRGISAGTINGPIRNSLYALFLLDDKWKPVVNASRSQILRTPLEIILAVSSIFNNLDQDNNFDFDYGMSECYWSMLPEWREIRFSPLGDWLLKNQKKFFDKIEQRLHTPQKEDISEKWMLSIVPYRFCFKDHKYALYKYYIAILQDSYHLTIDYDAGQTVTLCAKLSEDPDEVYNLFPPMMFCKASTNQNRRYLCSVNPEIRRGITVDHPFAIWLLENAALLNKYFPRQLQQIIHCLCSSEATEIIQVCNDVRTQLLDLPERHNIKMSSCRQLDIGDFWFFDKYD